MLELLESSLLSIGFNLYKLLHISAFGVEWNLLSLQLSMPHLHPNTFNVFTVCYKLLLLPIYLYLLSYLQLLCSTCQYEH